MRTTIDLPDPLFKEAKSVAALRNQTLKDVVVRALRRELRDGRSTTPRRGRPTTAFPALACKGDFVIRPTKDQLPDANLWLALLLCGHVHHAPARRWLAAHPGETLVFRRLTQLAFLRHTTNAAIMGPNVLTQARAWQEYEGLIGRDEVVFLPEPNGLEIRWRDYTKARQPAHRTWTDAYLAAFARGHGLRLVTFDRGMKKYEGTDVPVLGAGT
jgi:toxin-antitoxin system PIN domain toxin